MRHSTRSFDDIGTVGERRLQNNASQAEDSGAGELEEALRRAPQRKATRRDGCLRNQCKPTHR